MKPEFLKSLYEVTRRLNVVKFSYMLVGSSNLSLQGMAVEPNDIDIAVAPKDFAKLEEAFPEYELVNLDESELFGKKVWKMKMGLDGVEIEFFTEENGGVYMVNLELGRTLASELEDIEVVCLVLPEEQKIYQAAGRTEKSELIKAYLEE